MSTSIIEKSIVAISVTFTESMMPVIFEDGRELSAPLEWFRSLRDASKSQLENWRFIGRGEGIHWEDLDEDISVEGLLR